MDIWICQAYKLHELSTKPLTTTLQKQDAGPPQATTSLAAQLSNNN